MEFKTAWAGEIPLSRLSIRTLSIDSASLIQNHYAAQWRSRAVFRYTNNMTVTAWSRVGRYTT